MIVGLLGNKSSDSNRFILVTPKPENGVRLQATLGNQNPTGLPVGVVSEIDFKDKEINLKDTYKDIYSFYGEKEAVNVFYSPVFESR